MDSTTADVVIGTANPLLLDDLLRLCAAAGVTPDVVPDAASIRRHWRTGKLVLIGDDVAPAVAGLGLLRRDCVVLALRGEPGPETWRLAMSAGVGEVAGLPGREAWLIERLADASDGATRRGTTVAVVGGRGGAGSSTLACGIGLAATRLGRRAILVDGDPRGGGLDLLFGCEAKAGLRWPDLTATRGRVSARALLAALPEAAGVSLLSWDRGCSASPPAESVRSVLAAAARGADLVVVDLPRWVDEQVAEVLAQVEVALLLVPAEVRAVAAAHHSLAALRTFVSDIRLVVRDARPSRLPADEVATSLALPLAGEVSTERAVFESVERGDGPGSRGRFARRCTELVLTLPARGPGRVAA